VYLAALDLEEVGERCLGGGADDQSVHARLDIRGDDEVLFDAVATAVDMTQCCNIAESIWWASNDVDSDVPTGIAHLLAVARPAEEHPFVCGPDSSLSGVVDLQHVCRGHGDQGGNGDNDGCKELHGWYYVCVCLCVFLRVKR